MSTKSTVLLTDDNEHWYFDCSSVPDDIIIEIDKKNITILEDDEDNLIISIKPNTSLYEKVYRSFVKGAWFNNSWK